MGSSQCRWMCKGTPLLLRKGKETHIESCIGAGRRAKGHVGSTSLKSSSSWAFPHVCLGRVMRTQGTIETTNNNGGPNWLALIKSRLLWLHLSTVITRNPVMSIFFFFSFASNRFPVLTLTTFHAAQGIHKFNGTASVFWEDFQFL